MREFASMFFERLSSRRVVLMIAMLGLVAARMVMAQVSSDAPDLVMYGRIRDEGNARSRVMDYATELMDGIGPRLTGSPGLDKAILWVMNRLAEAGSSNVRKESWGEFGIGWRQRNVWVRLMEPYPRTSSRRRVRGHRPRQVRSPEMWCRFMDSTTRAGLACSEARCAARSSCSEGRRVFRRRSRSISHCPNASMT